MKLVKIKGGLGHQMFQYAFACALAEATGSDVRIDTSASRRRRHARPAPSLLRLNLSLEEATRDEIRKTYLFPHKEGSSLFEKTLNPRYYVEDGFCEDLTALAKKSYFEGVWREAAYAASVEARLREEFRPAEVLSEETLSQIAALQKENAVLVGIKGTEDAPLDAEYYESAMQYVAEREDVPVFHVFTASPDKARAELASGEWPVRFHDTTGQDDFEMLWLAAACRHAIIPDSSFFYWAAWLAGGTNDPMKKMVIVPRAVTGTMPPAWITR